MVLNRMRIADRVPGVRTVRAYDRRWLTGDAQAGLVLTALLVPQGMAYAALAGLPPVAGLYATMVPLLAYAALGPSRLLVLGPDSAITPAVAAAVIPLAGADPNQRWALASMLALIVGGVMVVGGLTRVGFVTALISKPVRLGFLAGIAATAIASQLPALLGLPGETGPFREIVADVARHLDQADGATVATGAAVIAAIALWERVLSRGMAVLFAVVGATAVVAGLGLADSVQTVGDLPEGLPRILLPDVSGADAASLLGAGIGIALVAFADTTVLSRSYATRLSQDVDQSHELAALGAANIAAGLAQGFPVSSSASRTLVAEAAGARTQLTGVVAAAALGAVLLVGGALMHDLPFAALAAVVIVAVAGLVDVPALRRLAHADRQEFALAVVSFGGVVVVGVLPGIGIAVGVSLGAFLWRVWHPYSTTLGRRPRVKGYHDTSRHRDAAELPGLVLLRFDAPLFFANAGVFHDRLLQAVRTAPSPARWVVIAAEPITDVDSTAADMLFDVTDHLEEAGVILVLAELKGPVKDALRRYGLIDRIGEERVHPTLGAAVHAYALAHGLEPPA